MDELGDFYQCPAKSEFNPAGKPPQYRKDMTLIHSGKPAIRLSLPASVEL